MKNILFPFGIIIGVFFCWFPSYCVAGIQLPPTCVDSKTDQNGFLNELSTEDFNKSTIGALVDGVFVKSLIGVNMDSLRTFNVVSDGPLTIKGIKTENDSIVVTQKDFHKNPVRINGVDYIRLERKWNSFLWMTYERHIFLRWGTRLACIWSTSSS